MLKSSRKKVVLLFTFMLLMFVFIGINKQTISNIAYISGGAMSNLAYITGGAMSKVVRVIPFIF